MVLDYSKWDKIELSDDSDIEVHPNVDKRSFIQAKQRQIHQDREVRKRQIANLQMELSMNSVLLRKTATLVSILEAHDVEPDPNAVMSALTTITDEDDGAPEPPEGALSYTQMMAALVDTIKKEVDDLNPSKEERWKVFLGKMQEHKAKLQEVCGDSEAKLAKLEKEDGAKITADSIHEGFSAGHVTKSDPAVASASKEKKKVKKQVQAVEQINPSAAPKSHSGEQSVSSGAEADIEEDAGSSGDDVNIEPSALGREFAQIPRSDYRKLLDFISRNPAVVVESETDGLLIEAFNSQIAGKESYAQTCVHHALLLQYCQRLGRDGVALFFKRITTANHNAQRVFHDDVVTTYTRIRERAKEIAIERNREVETIQLQAADPGTELSISIPPPEGEAGYDAAKREIFESFPPGLRRALEKGTLEEINKVLGKMSMEEAQEVLEKFDEGDILSVNPKVLDPADEEDAKRLEEMRLSVERVDEGSGTEVEEKGKGKEVGDLELDLD